MNIQIVTKLDHEQSRTACFFVTTSGLAHVKQVIPEVAPFLTSEYIKMDNTSILTLPRIVNGKKSTLHILGFSDDASTQDIYDGFGLMAKKFTSQKFTEETTVSCDLVGIASILENKAMAEAAIKGLQSGAYAFNKFFSEPETGSPHLLPVYTGNATVDTYMKDSLIIAESILLARQLVDEPSNLLKPEQLAMATLEALANTDVEVTILEEEAIQKLNMHLYLAVASGSKARPRLIVMRYNGNPNSEERIGLIGKGITYDSGGYSIKPTSGMCTMKSDMGGAAAVIGAMKLIAAQKPAVNVVGVIAACENMISGSSYLPGDIITSMNGKTVEIANTDAEGRLTLADAMTYAIREEHATKVVDICTLTGACLAALGEEFAGVITWDNEIWNKVEQVSESTLEPCWRLPLTKRLQKKNKSKVADLCNIGGRWAGTITAGSFVGEFSEGKPWVHFDIAGTAYIEEEKPAMRVGGTGYGVHLLAELVKVL